MCAGPSSASGRQHLNVTILELSSSPTTGGCGLDSDPDKLSFLSSVSTGGLEPPIVMTPSGVSPERRESNNSSRSFAGGGVSHQQQSRSSGSDVLADNSSDTYGPGGELHEHGKPSYLAGSHESGRVVFWRRCSHIICRFPLCVGFSTARHSLVWHIEHVVGSRCWLHGPRGMIVL